MSSLKAASAAAAAFAAAGFVGFEPLPLPPPWALCLPPLGLSQSARLCPVPPRVKHRLEDGVMSLLL